MPYKIYNNNIRKCVLMCLQTQLCIHGFWIIIYNLCCHVSVCEKNHILPAQNLNLDTTSVYNIILLQSSKFGISWYCQGPFPWYRIARCYWKLYLLWARQLGSANLSTGISTCTRKLWGCLHQHGAILHDSYVLQMWM